MIQPLDQPVPPKGGDIGTLFNEQTNNSIGIKDEIGSACCFIPTDCEEGNELICLRQNNYVFVHGRGRSGQVRTGMTGTSSHRASVLSSSVTNFCVSAAAIAVIVVVGDSTIPDAGSASH